MKRPRFQFVSATAQQAGIQFCYHNHNFEFTKYGDTTVYEYFLKTLDPKLVKYEMDCFWVTHAGEDPVSLHGASCGTAGRNIFAERSKRSARSIRIV